MLRHPPYALALALILLAIRARGNGPRPHAVSPRDARATPVLQTYTDAVHGYTLRYPRTWMLKTGVPTTSFHAGLDALTPFAVVFASADTDAGLIAVAGRGTYSRARIIQTETRVLKASPGETRQGSIVFGSRVIDGVVFREARATFKTRAGTVGGRVLMATRRGFTYFFVVVLTPSGARAAADRAEAQAIVGSIVVRP